MIAIPPPRTTMTAMRSRVRRRERRAPKTEAGGAVGRSPHGAVVLEGLSVISGELLELRLDHQSREWIVAVLDDDPLSFLRQDHLDELLRDRVGRLARRLVDVDVEIARDRV